MHYLNIVGYYRKKRILKELKQIINLFILLFVIKRSRSSVWLERLTVTQEVASSSLVDSAKMLIVKTIGIFNLWLILLIY